MLNVVFNAWIGKAAHKVRTIFFFTAGVPNKSIAMNLQIHLIDVLDGQSEISCTRHLSQVTGHHACAHVLATAKLQGAKWPG